MFIGTIIGAKRRKFGRFSAIFDILHSSWHNHVQKPDPLWHTFGVQNPTFSGTLLENPTLCGTEFDQNGTLAVLAYAYCRLWEYPPGAMFRALLGVICEQGECPVLHN